MIKKKKKYHLPEGYSLLQSIGRSYRFLKDPINFISASMVKFSGTYTATLGPKTKLILTQDPDFINYVLKENHKNYIKSELATERAAQFFGRGLLFSNGNYWLRQRRLIQPAFHREKIQALSQIVINAINDSLRTFPTGERIDVYPLVHRLSFNILIKSLFDIRLSPEVMKELSDIFGDLQDFLIKDVNQPFRKLFYPITGSERITSKKSKRLREILRTIILERRESNETFSDLLDMLLNSRYEDTGEAMSEDQIIDEVLILIFAGHETTANSLGWALYLIASNDDVQQRLIKSIDSTDIYNCINNEYLRATINEGMRLFPAAWMTERVSLEDDCFGNYSFPKNTIIIPFFFGLHRNNKFWQQAPLFDPDRFIEDEKLARSRIFFPFGAGPRLCIGNNFAMQEMSFFLYSFFREFQIKPTGQIPEMKALITLSPDKVLLNIHKRSV